jgi:hypothetical protein
MLTWRIWWAPNNASKGQMGFNSAFKGLRSFWGRLRATFALKQKVFLNVIPYILVKIYQHFIATAVNILKSTHCHTLTKQHAVWSPPSEIKGPTHVKLNCAV